MSTSIGNLEADRSFNLDDQTLRCGDSFLFVFFVNLCTRNELLQSIYEDDVSAYMRVRAKMRDVNVAPEKSPLYMCVSFGSKKVPHF